MAFTPELAAFRFYDDDGGESGSTPTAAQDTNVSVDAAGSNVIKHLRLRVDETGGTSGAGTDDWRLQVSKNAGAYTDVGIGTASVRAAIDTTFPVVADEVEGTTEVAATAHTVDLPPIRNEGLLLKIIFFYEGAGAPLTIPAGWTATSNDADGTKGIATVFKTAGASEPATVEFTTDSAVKAAWFSQSSANVSGSTAQNLAVQNTSTPDVANSGTASAQARQWYPIEGHVDGTITTDAFPTNYTDGRSVGNTSGGVRVASARRDLNAATEDPGAFTLSATADCAVLMLWDDPDTRAASQLTDEGATTNRATNGISDPASGVFVAGVQESRDGLISDHQLTANNFTEHVFALEYVAAGLVNGDTLDFRLLLNGSPITASVTPRVTVSAGADTHIAASTEALTLTTQQASVGLDTDVAANAEALTLTTLAASIVYDVDVQANTEALALTPQQASVSLDVDISTGVESLSLSTNVASVALDADIQAAAEALTLTPQPATITYDVNVQAAVEALTLTAFPASLGADTNIATGVEALTLATQPATVTYDVEVLAGVEALTLATLQAFVALDVEIGANVEALSLGTHAATVANDVNVQAATEALTVTTFPATFGGDVDVAADVEALTLTTFPAQVGFEEVETGRRIRGGGYLPQEIYEQLERVEQEKREEQDTERAELERLYRRVVEGEAPERAPAETKPPETRRERKEVARTIRAMARERPEFRGVNLNTSRLERMVAEFVAAERMEAFRREEEEVAAVLLLAA